MALVILIAFLTLPLVEITLFILVGDALGLGMTIGLVLLTTLGGAWLLRYLGFTALQRLQEDLARHEYPEVGLFNAVCLFAAAVLLIVPGFFTDILGMVLFIPGLRDALRRVLFRHLVSSGVVFVQEEASFSHGGNRPSPEDIGDDGPVWRHSGGGDDIIEGEFEDLTPDKKKPGPGAPSLPDNHERDNREKENGETADGNGTSSSS